MDGVYYDLGSIPASQGDDLDAQIEQARALLEDLGEISARLDGARTGDADFDVELLRNLNIARVSMMRYRAMLIEQGRRQRYGDIELILGAGWDASTCSLGR